MLAGGRGLRLKPVTDYLPKPLVPVAGIPILERQARYLAGHGISKVVVCAGYRAAQIRDYIEARKRFGMKMEVLEEKEPLGTGGAAKRAARHLGDPFLLINGDTLTDIDLSEMKPDSVACVQMRTGYGTVESDGDRVTGFFEKKHITNVWMNAGIYCLTQATARRLPARGDLERTTFPAMAKNGTLSAIKFPDASWFSVDSHKDLEECAKVIRRRGGVVLPSGRRPRRETPRRRG